LMGSYLPFDAGGSTRMRAQRGQPLLPSQAKRWLAPESSANRKLSNFAAAKQFTWVSTDSPPLILSPRYVKILVRRNCGQGG
jgi:hypothetical protein